MFLEMAKLVAAAAVGAVLARALTPRRSVLALAGVSHQKLPIAQYNQRGQRTVEGIATKLELERIQRIQARRAELEASECPQQEADSDSAPTLESLPLVTTTTPNPTSLQTT